MFNNSGTLRRTSMLLTGLGGLVLGAILILFWPSVMASLLATQGLDLQGRLESFEPHGHCYLWMKPLLWLHAASDTLIGAAYVAISTTLIYLVARARRDVPFHWMFVSFGIFIVACGATHLMEVWITFFTPVYWLAGYIKALTALASVFTALVLPGIVPRVLQVVQAARLSNQRQGQLEDANAELETLYARSRENEAALQQAHNELERARDNLEIRVAERTSELELAGAELRSSETSFSLLTEVMPQIVWTARPDGFLEYYNRRWVDYTGMSIEQTQGWGWQPVLHPDDMQNTTDAWQHATQSGEAYQVEYRFKRASDGMYRWHLGRAMPLRDEGGTIIKWFGTCTDIHDQKQAQQELQRSHTELEARVQERTAELSQANAAQQHLLGELEKANAELENRVLSRTESLAQINGELQIAKEEAERADAAKGEFLSRMSHELRTPLNAVLGFGQLLEMQERQLSARQNEGVQHILKAGRHLLGLVNEVLDITRINAPDSALSTEAVNLEDVTKESLDMMQVLARPAGISLVLQPWTRPISVLADRQRLLQILLNLLANAIKYNKPGGSVTLSCELLPVDRMRLRISDTGHGIAAEDLSKLFVPFSRLNAEALGVEGTGLGLVLCQRLALAMNGSLHVESRLGEGSTFSVELPLAGPVSFAPVSTKNEEPRRAALGASPGATDAVATDAVATDAVATDAVATTETDEKVVLLIEDNLSNFNLIETIFASLPEVRLVGAIQGSMGVELARQHQPDLILLDLHLPDIMGDEVLRRLQALPITQNVPVIILSADATPAQIGRLLAQGAQQYLTKPLDVKQFLEAINETLQ